MVLVATTKQHRPERKQRRRLTVWIGLIGVFATVLGLAWVDRPSLLRGVAKLWTVSDDLQQADAIVVLGGGIDFRPAAAAELYRRGIASRVAVGISDTDRGQDGRRNRDVLLEYGVPPSAIVGFAVRHHSTYGEARGILEWARASGAKSVIIPTDIFPTRRTRWIFNRELAPAGIRVSIRAVTPPTYGFDDWWRREAGWNNFKSELIKLAYYRLRY